MKKKIREKNNELGEIFHTHKILILRIDFDTIIYNWGG